MNTSDYELKDMEYLTNTNTYTLLEQNYIASIKSTRDKLLL